ncbi:hypothetical protein BDZ91DRAFT_741641 [Kalaharituber pfeilii]|nr:hypothetical protein BDZ91DRAFT_741641 [Kalaharituber pfeilii]
MLDYYLICYPESIPLLLIHPCWHLNKSAWDPYQHWTMTLDNTQTSLSTPLLTPNLLPDPQGRYNFVQTTYNLESHFAAQPAHIAAHQVREFQQTVQALQTRWKTPTFPTTILPSNTTAVTPSPEPSFRTQFRIASGTPTSHNPKTKGTARGPTGAKVAEAELAKWRAIQERDNIAENYTQDSVQSRRIVQEDTEVDIQVLD